MLIPEQQEVAMGRQAFAEVTEEASGPTDSRYASIVQRVGTRIADVSGRSDYEWETRVVASQEQNAYCLPGGKIVVYDGILPVCENEAGLAVVMSHEVAHVLARHGGERMSQQSAMNGLQTAVGYALRNKEQVSRDIWMKAYGMATTYGVILPYSRKHESEADEIGLMLMAEAGYDPAEAPKFWKRFAKSSQGEKPAEFLSTHPADARRAADLEKLLPQASEIYRKVAEPIGAGELIRDA
jgi:predicted Zn-dependent protease